MENMVNDTLNSFYKNKKIFLTGHTGFKGSWMLAWLYSMGCIVKGYALPPENKYDLYNVITGNDICQSIIADIREKEKLKKELLEFQPDIIFHLAAQPLVRYSYHDPIKTFEVNSMGTVYILDALRSLEKQCSIIVVTTDKVYLNKDSDHLYKETDLLGGYDPYSASKAAAEIITDSYRNSFFNIDKFNSHQKAIASARAGNVIGGGDWNQDRIIPDIVKALQKNETIILRNPGSIRPWQFVLDPISGYLLLGKKLHENHSQFSGAWNFGPPQNDNLTVKEIVEFSIKCWGKGKYETPRLMNQPHEAKLLKLDANKAVHELNWKPKYNSKKTIENTILWYKQSAMDQKDYTYKQLNDYTN